MKPVVEGQDHALRYILLGLVVSFLALVITTLTDELLHSFPEPIGLILWGVTFGNLGVCVILASIIGHLEQKTKSKGNYIQ